MTDNRRNHLRAWREHRGLTQAQLAEIVGTEGSVISLLESGDRALSDKWLRRVAPALGTTPGILLDYDPNALGEEPLKAWFRAVGDATPIKAASTGAGKRARPFGRTNTPTDPYEIHNPRVDPGYDIPELWWRIPDEDKPAALAALRALITRN